MIHTVLPNRKLVRVNPRQKIRWPDHASKLASQANQHSITSVPSMRCIDPGQVVDVDQRQCSGLAVQIEPVYVPIDLIDEPSPVGQTSQMVDPNLAEICRDQRLHQNRQGCDHAPLEFRPRRHSGTAPKDQSASARRGKQTGASHDRAPIWRNEIRRVLGIRTQQTIALCDRVSTTHAGAVRHQRLLCGPGTIDHRQPFKPRGLSNLLQCQRDRAIGIAAVSHFVVSP